MMDVGREGEYSSTFRLLFELRELLRSFCLSTTSIDKTPWRSNLSDPDLLIWYLYADFLTQSIAQPSGARLIRELLVECVGAYEEVLQMLEFFFESGATVS